MSENKKGKKEEIEDRVLVSDVFTSKVYKRETKTVNGRFRLKDSLGIGIINQILLKGDGNDYTIQVIIDDAIMYNDPYSFFFTNSEHIDNVSAYLAAGVYYLTLQNISFQKSLIVRIITTTSIIFNLMLIRYAIRNEISQSED
ncbi:hypothetical protein LCGC14_2330180 [marine sediment metagenome]|uniref:Uncharacterized protein n=1 Tax=marine sediment metagenome TaxID=412755 RepID=A0A0F9D2L8_9ZZZZ